MSCVKNLEQGLILLGAPRDIREFLERGGIIVVPCPMCTFMHRAEHLLKIHLPYGGRYHVEEIAGDGKDGRPRALS